MLKIVGTPHGHSGWNQGSYFVSEVKFSCPQCQQRIGCEEAYRGQQIQCPACGTLLEVPLQHNLPGAKLSINRPQTTVSRTTKPMPEPRPPVAPRRSLLPRIALLILP